MSGHRGQDIRQFLVKMVSLGGQIGPAEALFFKYKEKHDKIKNAQRNPPSSLIIIIGPLGGLFLVQF